MSRTWVIIDSNYLAYRAFYSVGGLSYKNTPTGATFGYLGALLQFQTIFPNSELTTAHCFDSKKSKRRRMAKRYKHNRRKARKKLDPKTREKLDQLYYQINKLRRKYLFQIGYQNVFHQVGYEADDLIASACKNLVKEDEAIIISSDKDMYQLITKQVKIYNPRLKEMMTLERFKSVYGIHPSYWSDVKALAGCNSDEIKGVPGIGEKTAVDFLLGKLDHTTKTKKIDSIMSREGKFIQDANKRLVHLPLKGTKQCVLIPDKKLGGWNAVMKSLNIKTLRMEK